MALRLSETHYRYLRHLNVSETRRAVKSYVLTSVTLLSLAVIGVNVDSFNGVMLALGLGACLSALVAVWLYHALRAGIDCESGLSVADCPYCEGE